MSQDAHAEADLPVAKAEFIEDVRWIKCRGCKGEVGIPSDWSEQLVECPQCGLQLRVHGKVLYRPSVEGPSPARAHFLENAEKPRSRPRQRVPSLELGRTADHTLILGIVSILLGWTVIIPLIGWLVYLEAAQLAKRNKSLFRGRRPPAL
jgi:hypothetical protein